MASSVFSHAPSSSFTLHFNSSRPFSPQLISVSKHLSFTVKASTSVDYSIPSKSSPVAKSKPSSWQWKFGGNSVDIHFERLEKDGGGAAARPRKDILLVPTISDVSTVEEWRVVAEEIVGRESAINWSATIVDWPGLGYSGRPKLDYNADVMERFLVDFVNAPDSPISSFIADNEYVVFGGGHGATIAVRATKNGFLTPKAIAAVAPTWAGPLPIVFGKDSNMETRYGLLRGTLRAPALGWMMYNVLVSNEKAIQSQYKSHVYADPENVTRDIIESRYELTKRKGARYVPAAFLTGLLDPVSSREEFLELFSGLQGKHVPILVMSTSSAPKRSKAEMEALRGAKGVSKFVEVKGALLPQEEYPKVVAEELYRFLVENFESED
ncbi:alpha/beta-Hydrolases superfamily protein [Striga asiatica]|uniref:Alpha/beta-Hydrolases superfamily protein n=1 Tax=Striga asiatica TaxID=4170 RepID=A0A5A7P356_STRAF|nr:alpha/beta-Hydrolases superfamily protein [Striga asiatica]